MALQDVAEQLRNATVGAGTVEQNITTPVGFFNDAIAPVFEQDIFSQENLATEMDRPEMTNVFTLRQNISDAANDEDLSLLQFDAAANLARQKVESDLQNRDAYTRLKRDLEFNINAERDVQFQQGSQLLRDIDAFTEANRATVMQREYEKELERQEELLKEQKKEELQMMAMQMGIDPTEMSRKELIKNISAVSGRSISGASGSSRGSSYSSGGKKQCPYGYTWSDYQGGCIPTNPDVYAADLAVEYDRKYGDAWKDYFTYGQEQEGKPTKQQYIEQGLRNQVFTPRERGTAIQGALGGIDYGNSSGTSSGFGIPDMNSQGTIQFKTEEQGS